MNRRCIPRVRRIRGLSLVELILALSMTALVASGVAGMLAGVGTGIAVGRDARTSMLAASASQRRILDDLADHACVLESTPTKAVAWSGDLRSGGEVEASELAWISFDPTSRTLAVERVSIPDDWSAMDRAFGDPRLEPGQDPWTLLAAMRTRGIVQRRVLADGLIDSVFTTLADGATLRIDLEFDLDSASGETTVAVAFRGTEPGAW